MNCPVCRYFCNYFQSKSFKYCSKDIRLLQIEQIKVHERKISEDERGFKFKISSFKFKWFTIINELGHLSPYPYSDTDANKKEEVFYDSSNEPVICREFFFDPEFQYSIENSENALNDFITHLDSKANPYLRLKNKAS